MAKRTNSKGFITDLKKILAEYGEEVLSTCTNVAQKNAQIYTKKLQQIKRPPETTRGTANPRKRREWNKYAKGWNWTGKEDNSSFSVTIYNKNHYRLTHLLEYGHRTINGKETRAFEHIRPIEKELVETYMQEVEKNVGK